MSPSWRLPLNIEATGSNFPANAAVLPGGPTVVVALVAVTEGLKMSGTKPSTAESTAEAGMDRYIIITIWILG